MSTTDAREETAVGTTLTVASVIGGHAPDGAPGGRMDSTNPARTAEKVAEVLLGDGGTFVEACRSAREAQRKWADVPAPIRSQVIKKIGRIVENNKEPLARLVTREIGKPYPESLGEVQEIVDTCDFFVGEGRRLYGQTVPSEMPDKQLFTFRNPVGVAAIITAGNFPVAVPSWYLVPAIVCGNAVVWKPAEYSPAVGEALAELFTSGGLPDGVLNLVQCDGPTAFEGLEQALGEGLVDKVGFTGSSAVGTRIGELCGRHIQSPCLELGGKNPLVVMPDADLDLAAEGALFSGFGTAGQRCTSLGTVIVHDSVHDEFMGRFTRLVEGAAIGDPTEDVLYRPTIVDRVRADDDIYSTETFGPIVGVASFSGFDQAVELANGHGYGLSAAIYTTDAKNAFRFRERVSAGMLSVNNSTSGAEAHLPFGGNGRSGNGSRQSGMWVLDQFTRWQSMNWDYAGKLQKAQMEVAELTGNTGFRLAWD